jgi:hypothetical protein
MSVSVVLLELRRQRFFFRVIGAGGSLGSSNMFVAANSVVSGKGKQGDILMIPMTVNLGRVRYRKIALHSGQPLLYWFESKALVQLYFEAGAYWEHLYIAVAC